MALKLGQYLKADEQGVFGARICNGLRWMCRNLERDNRASQRVNRTYDSYMHFALASPRRAISAEY
jgi:hypothetical protein